MGEANEKESWRGEKGCNSEKEERKKQWKEKKEKWGIKKDEKSEGGEL